eukprot:6731550-Alexandrium_andersonii.AAC.1
MGAQRETKGGVAVADVQLIDKSETSAGVLATITVSVFGARKLEVLKDNVGEAMVFFNLSVTCNGSQLSVAHFEND